MRPPSNDYNLTTNPLPYQIGPFGNFYLPANSPLVNAGSRSYAEAGLAHYTTRVDQTKESEETSGMVNIGLHYVAADATNRPKDADGEGIPDFVEDANGNGLVDSDETNPLLAHTQPGVFDPANTKYDDIDLDGDGMVGRIKKALGTNPLVPDNPLTLTQVITGEEPGIVTFSRNDSVGGVFYMTCEAGF